MESEACEVDASVLALKELLARIENQELRRNLSRAIDSAIISASTASTVARADQNTKSLAQNSEILTQLNREMRIPLNAILVLSEALTKAPCDDNTRHNASLIKDAGQNLSSLLEGVLAVAKIDVGEEDSSLQFFDLNILIEDVFQTLALENLSFGKPIKLDIQAPLSEVNGQASKLRQILLHLTKQAMRFASSRITLKVTEKYGPVTPQQHLEQAFAELEFFIGAPFSLDKNTSPSWSCQAISPPAASDGILRPHANLSVYIAQRLLNSLDSDLFLYECQDLFCYAFKLRFSTTDHYAQTNTSMPNGSGGTQQLEPYDLTVVTGIDEKALLKRFNQPVAKTVLKLFAQTATLELWKIENSLAKRCLTEVNAGAQTFINSCKTVCADDLMLVCADVERASRAEDLEEVRRLVGQLKEKVAVTLKEIKESCDK